MATSPVMEAVSPFSNSTLNTVSFSNIATGSVGSISNTSLSPFQSTPSENSYSSSPYSKHGENKARSSSLSSYSYNKKSRNSGKKSNLHLDISGPFPYFDQELKEEKEPESDSERELTKSELSKLEKQTLSDHGYVRRKFIATTLQGEVFNGALVSDETAKVVIKKTSKKLHKLGITITKTGKIIKVKENIVAEARLMKKFNANAPPKSLIEYYDFFEDSHYYYLVMENGGTDYFDFVVKCQDWIANGQLSLSEWRKHCKFMFAQMVQFIRWIHTKMQCAYLDISLENILIKETAQFDIKTGKLSGCYIKFIDFGLSQFFDLSVNPTALSRKYVGKTHYKAPKVYGKKDTFNAFKADVWSLGVCLFMMVVGAPPYNKPLESDITYQYIKYKQIAKLLQEWGRIKYVTSNLHDLITKMLTFDESERISVDEIMAHTWIKHYFPDTAEVSVPSPVITAASPPPPCASDTLPPNAPRLSPNGVSVSMSYAQQSHNNGAQPINAMVPKQAISYSVSRSRGASHSVSQNGAYYGNRRYTAPYSPQAYSPYVCSPNGGDNMPTPTPIMQSHTSKHDHTFFYAQASHDKGRKHKKGSKSKRKKDKKNKKSKRNIFKLFG